MTPPVKVGPGSMEATVAQRFEATTSPPTFHFTADLGTAFASPVESSATVLEGPPLDATRIESPTPGVTATRIEPLFGRAWVGRASARLALGDRAGAQAACARALELAPADPELRALASVVEKPAEK